MILSHCHHFYVDTVIINEFCETSALKITLVCSLFQAMSRPFIYLHFSYFAYLFLRYWMCQGLG